jgi:hypothetical protein
MGAAAFNGATRMVSARESSTFPHKDDAYPQRRVSGRDAHENAIELCKSQARAAPMLDQAAKSPSSRPTTQ